MYMKIYKFKLQNITQKDLQIWFDGETTDTPTRLKLQLSQYYTVVVCSY